jgi:cellobiose phosphorylase
MSTLRRSNGSGNANGTGTKAGAAGENDQPKFRENAEVNARIDAYIQNNPKEWAYIQTMPRERLERSLVLQSVQKQERIEKMRTGILKKLDENPELKEAYRTLVKNLPAEQQEKAMASIAMRTMRTVAPPKQQQTQAQQQTQGVRV